MKNLLDYQTTARSFTAKSTNRVVACTAAGLASVGLFLDGNVNELDASVVIGTVGLPAYLASIGYFASFDFDNNSAADIGVGNSYGNIIILGGNPYNALFAGVFSSGVSPLPSDFYRASIITGFIPDLPDSEPLFLMFSFVNSTDNQVDYGWLSLDRNGNTYDLTGWAYETNGTILPSGAIPEPASASVGLGLLALGAAGVRRWRNRRAQ